MAETPRTPHSARVDHGALRTNQVGIILLLIAAFAVNSWRLVGFVALVLLVGTAVPAAGLFKAIYLFLLKPLGLLKPDVREDDPAPHRFAQGVGGVVTLGSAALLAAGWSVTGWTLSAIVATLASLNLLAGICVGCLLYYQIGRLRLRGSAAPSVRGS